MSLTESSAAGGAIAPAMGEAVLESLFAMSPNGLALLDPSLRFVRVNARLAAMNGLPISVHLGRTPAELLPAFADMDRLMATAREALESGASTLEERLSGETLAAPGVARDWSTSWLPIRQAEVIVGLVMVVEDVTERTRAERALLASEERFRQLANAVPSIVWTADPDGTITFANDRWFAYCGVTPEANATRWPELVLHPDDRERCLAEWTRALHEGLDYQIEVRNRSHDGVYRWFLTQARPVRDTAGQITAWFGTTTDIHDRHEAEERLRESEERLRLATQTSGYGFYDYDVVHDRSFWTPELYAISGVPPETTVTFELIESLTHPDDREAIAARMAAALDPLGDGEFIAEFRIVRQDTGETRWVFNRSQTFFTGHGSARRAVRNIGVIADTTERKRLELREREFVAMAAHELKTPLTSLKGYAQLLQRRGVYDEERVQRIVNQANRLNRLVTDLLDAARVASGHLELRRQPLDLVMLVRRCVEEVQATSPSHTLRMSASGQPISGDWDGERLEQVVQNLLSNAVKYSPEGGEISVVMQQAGDSVELAVSDRGRGIPPEALARVFDRFYRVDEAAITVEGMGLGLHITRSFVEAHGGTIRAESAGLGQGATFILTLPIG